MNKPLTIKDLKALCEQEIQKGHGDYSIMCQATTRATTSTTAVANLLKTTKKDAMAHYIEPLRASEWLAVSSQGVIPGFKTHENYKIFTKKKGDV